MTYQKDKLTEDQIKFLDTCTEGYWHIRPKEGVVIDGSLNASGKIDLVEIPVRIYTVTKNVNLNRTGITSLKNSPEHIFKDLYCQDCPNLVSAQGFPLHLNGKIIYEPSTDEFRISLRQLMISRLEYYTR